MAKTLKTLKILNQEEAEAEAVTKAETKEET